MRIFLIITKFQFQRFFKSKLNMILIPILMLTLILFLYLLTIIPLSQNIKDTSVKTFQILLMVFEIFAISLISILSILMAYVDDVGNGIMSLENRMGLKKSKIFFFRYAFLNLNNFIFIAIFFIFELLIGGTRPTVLHSYLLINVVITQPLMIVFSLFFTSMLFFIFSFLKLKIGIGLVVLATIFYSITPFLYSITPGFNDALTVSSETADLTADEAAITYYQLQLLDLMKKNPTGELPKLYNEMMQLYDAKIISTKNVNNETVDSKILFYDGILSDFCESYFSNDSNYQLQNGNIEKDGALVRFSRGLLNTSVTSTNTFFARQAAEGSQTQIRKNQVAILKAIGNVANPGGFTATEWNNVIALCQKYYTSVLYKYPYYLAWSGSDLVIHNLSYRLIGSSTQSSLDWILQPNKASVIAPNARLVEKIITIIMYYMPQKLSKAIQTNNEDYFKTKDKLTTIATKTLFNPISALWLPLGARGGTYQVQYESMMNGLADISQYNAYFVKATSTDITTKELTNASDVTENILRWNYLKYPVYCTFGGVFHYLLIAVVMSTIGYQLWKRKMN